MKPEIRKVPYKEGMLVMVNAEGSIEWRGGVAVNGDNTLRYAQGREPVKFRIISMGEKSKWYSITNDFSEEDMKKAARNNSFGFTVGL